MDPGDHNITLDSVSTWNIEAMREFLSERGMATKGTKSELAALCFAAQQLKIDKVLSAKQISEQNKCDYQNLLKIDGKQIKDPLQIDNGWLDEKTGISQWPPVYCSDIIKFFMSSSDVNTTQHLLNEYKVGKAYEYFSSNWLKEVFFIRIESNLCILRARCSPSQRIGNDDHNVWVCIEVSSGIVKSAYCSCTAGLGKTCNHVAGVLFRVEAANKMGITACTAVPCSWNIPDNTKNKFVNPRRVADMEIKKSRHGQTGKQRPLVEKSKKAYSPVERKDHRLPLTEALREVIPNACVFKGLDTHVTTEPAIQMEAAKVPIFDIQKFHVESTADSIRQTSHSDCNLNELFYNSLCVPSVEEREAIQNLTKGQSANSEWNEMRKGRITASKFYSVYTKFNSTVRDPDVDVSSLLSNLMGYSKPVHVRATKHGLETEPEAKKVYLDQYCKRHVSVFHSECGLFVDKTYPFLSASPDLLVSCSCCGLGLLEVKCPLIGKCDKCNSFCTCQIPSYLTMKSGENLVLKENTMYHAQVQGQMAITGRKWCDFFVYTVNGHFLQRIVFNSEYFSKILNNLVLFFKKYMIPEILYRNLQSSLQNDRVEEPMCIEGDNVASPTGTISFCPVCRYVIKEENDITALKDRSVCCDVCQKWYHFACIKVTNASLSKIQTWCCEKCK